MISPSDNNADKSDGEIIELNTTLTEKSMDVDCVFVSSDSDQIQNETSVISTSDSGKLEKTTPTSKKANPKRKKQESAKKTEERLRLKLVSIVYS